MASNPLRHITRRPIGMKDALSAMLSAADATYQDDRSAAISAGALVELALEKAIKLRLRRMTAAENASLFEGTAPLATFSAKIRMGYALGIYDKEVRHDLETINGVRNAFAHSVHDVSFRSRSIANRVYGMHALKTGPDGEPRRRPRPLNTRFDYLGVTRNFWLLFVMLAPQRARPAPTLNVLMSPKRQSKPRRARSIKRKISSTASSAESSGP